MFRCISFIKAQMITDRMAYGSLSQMITDDSLYGFGLGFGYVSLVVNRYRLSY